MLQNKSFVGIIPARGGSKGIKNKNIKPLLGRPLIYYVIKAAQDSMIFDKIVVSTDDIRIKNIALLYGVNVIDRPISLAQDDTPTEPVISHALKQIDKFDYVSLLQPTSPLIIGSDITSAAKKLVQSGTDMIIGVTESKVQHVGPLGENKSLKGFYPKHLRKAPRQQLPKYYFINGGIYIGKWDIFYKEKDFYEVNSIGFVMHPDTWVDINYGEDLLRAEKLLKRREWAERFLK